MKQLLLTLPLLCTWTLAAQVDVAPREDAQKAALQLNNALGQPQDAPFKLETDLLNPFAIKAGQVAMLAVPVHSLKSKIDKADDGELVPAGQLWLHKVVPDIDGKSASADVLRLVTLETNDVIDEIAMFHLAIRTNESGANLLVYGAGKEVLLELPLRKMTVPQEAPIELNGRKRDETSGELFIYLGDHFEARLIVRPR